MANRKYNPLYHSSVVKNLRQIWDEAKQNERLLLTDEQVWEVFEEYYFDPRNDDVKYLEGLREGNQEVCENLQRC